MIIARKTFFFFDAYHHAHPQWSPDGNWIVYSKYDENLGNCQIYKIASSVVAVKNMTNPQFPNQKLEVYPPIFTNETTIRCSLNGNRRNRENMELMIYDISGRLVETTMARMIGKNLNPGIYFLKASGFNAVKVIKLM
ncbi:MAG: T9SS type A sorting domain-containing protein [Chitinispirillaceae bacterium]|nr:T9SS type A sorting domain-containing protein [Chitinispirillaceae bacterium]